MKLLSVIVGGVATIAVAKPVAVDPANGTEQKLAFMIKSCQATGLAGAVSRFCYYFHHFWQVS